ncbi:KH domain-containing, RNA-binding, signal transduction-associated protein 3 isoform X3 [Phoca vitulina]|uniref:KH domain-containing, RNA-binding, signal transduction-associated protein 3 isoform X3 n=1 Tax=Phoca vitulina TaxID=9720 RepID=UPI0013962DB0|nr:KH domain-containing, RNA-binding, signal transduction-associated protein 3 isoform X3 [Phoca vitulina]
MTSQHLLCDIPCGKLTWKGDIRNSLTTPLVFTEDVGVESCSLPYHVLFPPSPLCSVPGGRCGRHGGDLSRHSWPLACSWVSTCPADGTSSQLSGGREIEKFQKGEGKDEEKYIDVVINKNMKLGQKVLIPVKQFPKFNFVGKLLGPRGNSLKRLQEETLTKMSILGKGSMRDKAKEEELRKSGEAKYFHLNDDLHVLIEVFAPPAEAYARMGHALEEIKKFLIPDYNDEIRQAQLQELTYLNGGSENADVPVVRGKPTLRTRGVPTPAITRTMMMDMALLMMNRVMIPMITAIAPLPKVVLITMIMDMDSVKRHTIPTGKRTGLTRDTRHLQRGPRRASTETSPMADTDCTVWCCEIASLHQSCEMSAILGSRRNWLCPRSKQRGFPSNYGLLMNRQLTNVPSQ